MVGYDKEAVGGFELIPDAIQGLEDQGPIAENGKELLWQVGLAGRPEPFALPAGKDDRVLPNLLPPGA
jgi:hypothetical protein